MNILPMNLDDLVHSRAVESERLEFKKTWNHLVRDSVIRTICAFANDLHNLNGGYIIVGIEQEQGKPVLPPHGLEGIDLDAVQRELRGHCKRIDPEYQPVVSPEVYMGKPILVIWVPGGDVRPYQAPESEKGPRRWYVRLQSETVVAEGELRNQLMSLTARVPFDDRRRMDAAIADISGSLVQKFLTDIQSDWQSSDKSFALEDALRALRCSVKIDGHEVPRNVALMFFSDNPEKFFPGTRIEVAHFGDEAGGDLIEEQTFRGPLPQLIRQTLDHLNGLSTTVIRKVPMMAEAQKFVAFPFEAMEEAVVNAVLHRSYEQPPEPIKVGLYPDRMEITSYPGPMPGLELRHLYQGARCPSIAQRNRRIGEFLKELRLAEMRNTGIAKIYRKMSENGSPQPLFDFDQERSYFRVILPAHPKYVVLHALRESATLWATGERERAIARLEEARKNAPNAGVLAAQQIEYLAAMSDLTRARTLLTSLEQNPRADDRHLAYIALARAHLDRLEFEEARRLLDNVPQPGSARETLELAILYKRSEQLRKAHQLFAAAYTQLMDDPKAVHEFAQTKAQLAAQMRPKHPQEYQARRKLTREAVELLHRAIQLADNPLRAAWAWVNLARQLYFLRSPASEIREAYQRATALAPEEERFRKWFAEWESGRGAPPAPDPDPGHSR